MEKPKPEAPPQSIANPTFYIPHRSYHNAERILLKCPDRYFFPFVEGGNCWLDSTIMSLTFSDSIGKVLRAGLLGYLEKLRSTNVHDARGLFNAIESMTPSYSWRLYLTRMLTFLLLPKSFQTCPRMTALVENLRRDTGLLHPTHRKAEPKPKQKPLTGGGGYTNQAIVLLLQNLALDDQIVVEFNKEKTTSETVFIKYDNEIVHTFDKKDYTVQTLHFSLRREDNSSTGHVIVFFRCGDNLVLYDNNYGGKMLGNKEYPTRVSMRYYREGVYGADYTITYPNGSKEIVRISSLNEEPKAVIRYVQRGYIRLWSKDVYKNLKQGADLFQKVTAPRPVFLTPAAGPCPPTKVLNLATGRCVMRTGALGLQLLAGKSKERQQTRKAVKEVPAAVAVQCPPEKILNPATRRCVLRMGAVGRKLIQQ